MVKVGFIVEGSCEKIIIESEAFKNFLHRNGFELVEPVVDAKGAGNLLPHNIKPFIGVLEAKGAERLYILTDSDGLPVEDVKERINHAKITAYFIAVKAIEAWFLADTQAMKKFLEIEDFAGGTVSGRDAQIALGQNQRNFQRNRFCQRTGKQSWLC